MDIEEEIEDLKVRLSRIEIQLAQTMQTKVYGPVDRAEKRFEETVFTPRLFDSGKRVKGESIGRPSIEIGQGE